MLDRCIWDLVFLVFLAVFYWCVLARESCRARTDADAFVLTEPKSYRIGRARLASVSFAIVIASAPSIYLYPSISLSLSSIPSFRSAVLRRRYISLCSSFSCSCRLHLISSSILLCCRVSCSSNTVVADPHLSTSRPVSSRPIPSCHTYIAIHTRARSRRMRRSGS